MKRGCGWLCVFAGLWLFGAPFILGYSSIPNALWNDIILGLIVFSLGWFICLEGRNKQKKEPKKEIPLPPPESSVF